MFFSEFQMRMRRRQRCLPNHERLARALDGPRHIPSSLATQADVVQGSGHFGMMRLQDPSSKLQRPLLHSKRIFMSTEGTVSGCKVAHGVADMRMVGRQDSVAAAFTRADATTNGRNASAAVEHEDPPPEFTEEDLRLQEAIWAEQRAKKAAGKRRD